MTATFLALTNKALLRLNEVLLTDSTFASATGFQAEMKSAVNTAILDINQAEFQWPFNYVAGTKTLTAFTQVYALPVACKTVDWASFHLQRDDNLTRPVQAMAIPQIDYQLWKQRVQQVDDNSVQTLGAPPKAVFRTPNNEFGFTPLVDQAYHVTYDYWGYAGALDAFDDAVTIPDDYIQVIIDGAMYYGYLFRENFESAQLQQNKFKQGINYMRTLMINRYVDMRDTRVQGTIGNGFF